MNKHIHTDIRPGRHAQPPRHPHHPVGLLYTLLRHGKGLSHEEADRISLESVEALPPKAA